MRLRDKLNCARATEAEAHAQDIDSCIDLKMLAMVICHFCGRVCELFMRSSTTGQPVGAWLSLLSFPPKHNHAIP